LQFLAFTLALLSNFNGSASQEIGPDPLDSQQFGHPNEVPLQDFDDLLREWNEMEENGFNILRPRSTAFRESSNTTNETAINSCGKFSIESYSFSFILIQSRG